MSTATVTTSATLSDVLLPLLESDELRTAFAADRTAVIDQIQYTQGVYLDPEDRSLLMEVDLEEVLHLVDYTMNLSITIEGINITDD